MTAVFARSLILLSPYSVIMALDDMRYNDYFESFHNLHTLNVYQDMTIKRLEQKLLLR